VPTLNIVIPGRRASKEAVSFPHPEEPQSGVSKDEAKIGASWFETREDALLTKRVKSYCPFARWSNTESTASVIAVTPVVIVGFGTGANCGE
jgi:hypothetical protein